MLLELAFQVAIAKRRPFRSWPFRCGPMKAKDTEPGGPSKTSPQLAFPHRIILPVYRTSEGHCRLAAARGQRLVDDRLPIFA